MYINLLTDKNTPNFVKDTVHRFIKMIQINWSRFITSLSCRIIHELSPLYLKENVRYTWIHASQLLFQIFKTMLTDNIDIANKKLISL